MLAYQENPKDYVITTISLPRDLHAECKRRKINVSKTVRQLLAEELNHN